MSVPPFSNVHQTDVFSWSTFISHQSKYTSIKEYRKNQDWKLMGFTMHFIDYYFIY